MGSESTRVAAASDRERWLRVGVLVTSWLMWLFIGAWAITPSSILSVVMGAFGVREAAAAWIITAPQVAATIAGIPIGMYLDRVDRRRAILIGMVSLVLAGGGGTLAAEMGSYWALIAFRMLGGLGLVTMWTAQTALITYAFPDSYKATAVSVFVTGYPAGYAFGQFGSPVIANVLDWTATFAIYPAVALLFTGAFWLLTRRAGSTGAPERGTGPTRHELGRALANRGVWGIAIIAFLSYMLYMIFNSWLPTYISQAYDIGLTQSGLYAALFPAIGILARPGGGLLSDRVFDGRGRPVVGVSFLVAGLGAVGMALGASFITLIAGLLGAGFALQLQFGLLYTMAQDYVPRNVAGTTVAVISAIGWLGMFAGPPMVGALIELSDSYGVIFGLAGVLALGGIVTVVAISEPASGSKTASS